MARKKSEINPIRGQRLKLLLTEMNMSQQEFADMVGYTKEHISYIVNGKRNLTFDAAKATIKLFPNIRIEWLMAHDDFKTESELFTKPLVNKIAGTQAKKDAFAIYAALAGYNIVLNDESAYSNLSMNDWMQKTPDEQATVLLDMSGQLDKMFYNFCDSQGFIKVRCPVKEYESIVNEIADFAEFKIKKILQSR